MPLILGELTKIHVLMLHYMQGFNNTIALRRGEISIRVANDTEVEVEAIGHC